MTLRKSLTALVLTVALSLLAACDSAEQRAEKHFQSGMELLQAGDVDRALVEFRNVFQLNGRHREARIAYAEAERKRGNLREAYGQLLRLIEQYPDDMDGLRSLSEIATQSGEWDEADRHITAGLAIKPDDPRLLAARVAADYGRAASDGDETKLADAAKRASELVKTVPDSMLIYGILIDSGLRAQDYAAALKAIDAALVLAPDDTTLYAARISTLAAMGDDAGVETGLKDMVARFPGDQGISDGLVRWYVSRDNLDAAEDYLRKRIDPASADVVPTLVLIRFLSEKRSPDIAVAELDRIIAANPNPVFRSARAGLQFDLGKRDEAITEMTAILKDAPATDDTRKIKVGLAQMQVAVGNQIAARALVEEILAADEGNVEAMKLKASWLILGDEVGDAITILRKALDQNRRDASVMTLMAQAYERDGNRDLMREMLSMAVDASNNAPDESLRYAQFLLSENQAKTAEGVLVDALRLAPSSPMLLGPLGEVYIQIKDWPRAAAVAAELEALATPETTTAAAGLRAAILSGQQKTDQAIGYLQGLVDGGQGGLAPKIAIIRTHLAQGQNAEALAYSAKLLAENPTDASLRFIDASVKSATGDDAGAETVYRDLVKQDPTRAQVWMALFRSVANDPARADEAGPVLDDALAALPESAELKWAKAGYLERKGDIDGALAVYEALYAEDSMNMIVANNLASLLSTHHTDPESLERAEKIARRLHGSDVGAYQDTYGWIAYRRGNFEDAVPELEKAAAGLPDDPQVQYHLAMTYLALQRNIDALTFFTKSKGLATADDKRPFIAETAAEMDKLAAKGVTINN
jgi:cellulose synthase operon protein C